ncbi:hypothetical protein [Brevibacillus laterosporus]|uniref:hypothetical protein n=1 Tax=Brevibacillus laterosporus TaxID=1465 RepID=UPI001EF323C6|nr:hypothetical protein [Brevibacillus laterosporus]MCG7317994.1 hypothetical protein [Brevibacillus laterosporus]
MKKIASSLILSLVLGTTSLFGGNSALASEKKPIDLGEIRVGERDNLNQEKLKNLTDEEKKQIIEEHILKDGKLIQALDANEVKKAFNTIQSEGNEKFTFDDGSSITIKSGADTTSSQALVPNKTESATASANYLIESFTGLDLAEYTLYQDFEYTGSKVKSYDKAYSKYWVLPVISQWELVGEDYDTRPDGNNAKTTGGSKFKFGLWEIATFKMINVKGTLELYKDGTFNGWFKTL